MAKGWAVEDEMVSSRVCMGSEYWAPDFWRLARSGEKAGAVDSMSHSNCGGHRNSPSRHGWFGDRRWAPKLLTDPPELQVLHSWIQ